MIVDCAVYDEGVRRPGVVVLDEALEAASKPGSFTWIGLHQPTPSEFYAVRNEFGLHELAVEDAVKAHQRPKLEVYGTDIFVVLKTARYIDVYETVEFAEIQLFVGRNYVVSVRHGQASALAEVRKLLEEDPERLRLGPMAVLHAVMDHVVDDYEPVIAGLDNDMREIEVDVFASDRVHGIDPSRRIYKLKREILDFHRHTKPLLEALQRLQAGQVPSCGPALRDYFRDVQDHLLRVVAEIENFRDLLSDALNANLAQSSVRQNDDMRKISAAVAIGLVPTVVGAIYGMNFDNMPELRSEYGYPTVLVITVAVCYLLYRRFKKSGWL
jgi:magnesium transporter